MADSSSRNRFRKSVRVPSHGDDDFDDAPSSRDNRIGAALGAARSDRSPASSEIVGSLKRVLSRFVPAHVVINSKHEVVQFQGNAGRYLELAPGGANLNLFPMLRPGLMGPLRTTLRAANERRATARKRNVRVQTNSGVESVNIEITPLQGQGKKDWFVIVFAPTDPAERSSASAHDAHMPAPKAARDGSEVLRMREQLAEMRESLRMAIRQQDQTSSELRSANEDVQSANEELQSINEELETSLGELQTNNDQLMTVNEGLIERAAALAALNSELQSLLASLHVAAVVVESDLSIKCFTVAAEAVFNLSPGDVGRPLRQLSLGLSCPELEARLRETLNTGNAQKLEAHDKRGNRYSVRLRPYANGQKQIEGVTIVAIDLG